MSAATLMSRDTLPGSLDLKALIKAHLRPSVIRHALGWKCLQKNTKTDHAIKIQNMTQMKRTKNLF